MITEKDTGWIADITPSWILAAKSTRGWYGDSYNIYDVLFYVLLFQTGALTPLQCKEPKHSKRKTKTSMYMWRKYQQKNVAGRLFLTKRVRVHGGKTKNGSMSRRTWLASWFVKQTGAVAVAQRSEFVLYSWINGQPVEGSKVSVLNLHLSAGFCFLPKTLYKWGLSVCMWL